jgi:hypothetical protein
VVWGDVESACGVYVWASVEEILLVGNGGGAVGGYEDAVPFCGEGDLNVGLVVVERVCGSGSNKRRGISGGRCGG